MVSLGLCQRLKCREGAAGLTLVPGRFPAKRAKLRASHRSNRARRKARYLYHLLFARGWTLFENVRIGF